MPVTESGPLPSGVVTFLFTDIVGSTRAWEREPDVMAAAMARHDLLVEEAVAAARGSVVRPRGEGDSRFAVFTSPRDALQAAAALGVALSAERWPTSTPVRVRAAISTGEADLRAGDYYGDVVNRCARLRGVGHPDQVLVAESTARLVAGALPDGLALVDLGEHRLKDLSRPERVFQLTHPQLPAQFPALNSLNRVRHNLPIQLSSLVGRDTDVAAVTRLLGEHRLVTVTGFGGMGKTRLALQVAAELADGDGDGVWLVDLSVETDPARVAPVIATVLGVTETGEGPGPAVLRELADKRLLLVLDNLEQIPGAAAFITELLTAAPGVRVLATSRTSLRIRGEQEYALAPLGLAGPSDTADTLGSYAAVRLFIERAVEARQDFTVTNATAPAVAAICARLDGHPLSIELAAARIKTLAPDALLTRLESALRVLTGGGGDRPERHHTLRATIAWSYQTLTEAEQRLLDTLSVFPGTTTLGAVEDICGPAVGADIDVLDTLTALVDHSLVRVHPPTDDDPDTRYSLLVSIRDYGREQLDARGLGDDVARRHTRYYAALQQTPVDHRPEEADSLRAAIIRDRHNIRAALDYLQQQAPPDEEAEFFTGEFIAVVWEEGSFEQARVALEHVLARATEPSAGTAAAHTHLGLVCALAGPRTRTPEQNRRAMADARHVGRTDLYANAAICAAWDARTASDLLAAARDVDAALDALPEVGNNPPEWNLIGLWLHAQGHLMRYVDPRRALAACEADEVVTGVLVDWFEIHNVRASVVMTEGHYQAAFDVLGPVLERLPHADTPLISRVSCLPTIARVYLGLGDLQRAVATAHEAVQAAEEFSSAGYFSDAQMVVAECLFRAGDYAGSLAALHLAEDRARDADRDTSAGRACWRRARLLRLAGTPEPAVLSVAWQLLAGDEVSSLPDLLGCLVERAVDLANHAPEDALRLIGLVQARRRSFVLPMGVADEIEPLLVQLRARVGEAIADRVLAETAGGDLATEG